MVMSDSSVNNIIGKDDVFVIPQGETYEGNLMVERCGILIVAGTLKGNIASRGGYIRITGHVEGSIGCVSSKVFLSGSVKNVACVYSDIIVDGGTYENVVFISCRGEVLRRARVKNVVVKGGSILSLLMGLLLSYVSAR